MADPNVILFVDASINDRVFHVFFSLKGFFENFLIPNGYNAWLPYVTEQLVKYKELVIIEWFSLNGRIMSGYGSSLLLSAISIAVPLSLTLLFYNLFRYDKKNFFFFSIFVNLMMFSAIPLGFLFSLFFT